jgi:sugar/nucleoside kinase (ribokinase family)
LKPPASGQEGGKGQLLSAFPFLSSKLVVHHEAQCLKFGQTFLTSNGVGLTADCLRESRCEVKRATRNDWGAVLWADGAFHQAANRADLEILDRVGGGDSFASGMIYGFLAGKSAQEAVEFGAAHGALAMTTPGDTSMATLKEVEALAKGGSARVQR